MPQWVRCRRPQGSSFVQVELPDAAGTVHGVFFQVDGTTPIPSAQVHIRSARGENFTTTDASGVFSFQGVPLGGFSLDAFDPASARRAAGTGQVSADAQVVTADSVAQAIGTVTGVVTLSRGNTPAAGASVKLVDSEGFFSKQLQATSGPVLARSASRALPRGVSGWKRATARATRDRQREC